MPDFPDIVRAPPERVWRALVDPRERARADRFLAEARLESGKVGEAESVSLYRAGKQSWRERILEAAPYERLVVEERDPATDRTVATLAWRIEPVQLGSLVVLRVEAKGMGAAVHARTLGKGRYRRLVEAVKFAVEGYPSTRFEAPPRFARLRRLARRTAKPAPGAATPAEGPTTPVPLPASAPEEGPAAARAKGTAKGPRKPPRTKKA